MQPRAASLSGRTAGSLRAKGINEDTVKYKSYSKCEDALVFAKWTPSQHIADLEHPSLHAEGYRPKPEVVQLLNIAEHTHKVQSAVDIDQPLFQPFPAEVVFHSYEPFKKYEAALHLRNNDKVARRVAVESLDSTLFHVERVPAPGQAIGSKIAAGMEAVFRVSFFPESIESYEQQLVVVTEREKFIVPLLAVGASAALDLPDSICMPAVASKQTAKHSLLISNVGRRAGSFQLATSNSCFAVTPSKACLAPGETLQLELEFTPSAAGQHAGELQVIYEDSNRTTFTMLSGQGLELNVGLSESQVVFLPTYMGKLSQRSLRVFNHSDTSITFSLRAQPSAEAELAATCSALAAVQQAAFAGSGATAAWSSSLCGAWSPRATSGGSTGRKQHRNLLGAADVEMDVDDDSTAVAQQEQPKPGSAGSEGYSEDQQMLDDAQLAAMRRAKRARRDIVADKQLFGTLHFSVFPAEGVVHPHSEQDIIFQFAPDCAREFDALAWVELQGCGDRLPVQLQGQGLGAQVLFTYDTVDIGEAFVNTKHQYQVELLNKGKVDAHWSLQPCHTPFGSKFSFSPTEGVLQPGAGQVMDVRLLSDRLGQFDESFQVQLKGSFKPVILNIRGAVVGPQFALDVQSLDYSIASYGFRYTQEIMLTNTGAIPLNYQWHMAEDPNPAARDFTILPGKGTVLPYAKQKVQVEFQPLSVQRYNLNLVMDIPDVKDAAAKLPVVAECAVPIISLAAGGELLQFGQVFLRHPYTQQFTLVNESKLPAKFEVLPQEQQSQSLGTLTATPVAATIPAKGTFTVSLRLEAERLGRLQLPLYVRIAGSRNKPLQIIADAKAMGPSLEFAVLPASLPAAASDPCSVTGQARAAGSSGVSDSSIAATGGEPAGAAAPALAGPEASAVSAPEHSCVGAAATYLLSEASAVSRAASTVSTTGRARASSKAGGRQRSKSAAKLEPPPLEWAATAAVSFDKVQVLEQHVRELRLRNSTLVDADIKLFVEGLDSVFEVEPREAVVAAGGGLDVLVRVLVDDNITFRDVLHVLVSEGADVNIPLEATGVGNTVVSEVLSRSQLDFGAQFVGRSWQLEVEVANKGRKGAALTWSNSRLADLAKTFSKSAKGTGKKFDPAELPADQQPVFSISPDKVLLAPKETSSFIITGMSYKPGLVTEQLQCQYTASGSTASAGNKPKPVFDIAMTAEVAAPLLDISTRAVEFVYTHVRGSSPRVMGEPVEVRNVSKLPLTFTLKATTPFSIDPAALSLQPQESAVLNVQFDPDFQHDLVSQVVKQRCLISYPDNPHKDYLELTGVINFPNLSFDTNVVDFGCVLVDSMRRVSLDVTNQGCVPVEYCWSWVAQDGPAGEASVASIPTAARMSMVKGPKPPPNQLFDILPIHGVLQPGQKEQVEFSFYAYPGVKATALAACSVVDGPVYQFPVSGESNSIKYDVSPQFFDCGLQPYDRPTDRELCVSNSGKVTFDFNIDLSRLSRQGIIEVSPLSGKVAAGEKAKIKLKVKAGVPARLMELLLVSVAHFEPVQVQVLVEGTYPILAFNLPRIKDQAFLAALEAAQSANDVGLAATVTNTLDPTLMAGASSFKAMGRQGQVATAIHKGSKHPESVTGHSVAGTAISAAVTAIGRPGSAAKSQMTAVSGASAARSKASAATAASVGAMMAKDKLSQLFASLPADKRLDSEAERLRLVQQLMPCNSTASSTVSDEGSCASLKSSSNSGNSSRSADAATAAELPVQVPQQSANAATAVARTARRTPVAPKLPQLVSGHYVLDFGSVIKGVNKSKKVKMTNMSSQLVQFVVDKQTMESFGFGMVPEAAIKLAGAPECQSTEVTFTVMAAKNWVQPGPLELTLPMLIKGGPAVLLTLRALLVVPDVVCNETSLDFGTVSSNHCKVYTVQLHNQREVPAEWSIKKPAVDSPKLKDWSFFVAEPAEGVLEPGTSVNVKITFTPAMGRDAPYTLPLPIKVNYNPQPLELLCCGKGYSPKVEFNPRAIDCGAILPRFPGQLPAEATMQLTNLGDQPVEVVCLDLDKQYMEDEEMLRSLDIYNEAGVALLRPLAPGERPWPELLATAAQQKLAEAAATQQIAGVQQDQAGSLEAGLPEGGQMARDAAIDSTNTAASGILPSAANSISAAGADSEGVGELVPVTQQTQHHNTKTIVVLYGSPMAGTSTQAAMVASRYGIPHVTLDGLLQEAYSLVEADTAAATEDTIPEDAEVQSAGCQYDPRVKEVLSKVLESSTTTAALITADLGKVQQAASVAQSAAASRSSIVLQPPQVGQLTAAQLVFAAVKALKIALDQPQYEAGFVLDNIRSRFLPHPAFAARCLLLAIGLENKALQQHEGLMEPSGHSSLSGSGTGAAAGKSKDKAPSAVAPKSSSRPSSSRSGRGALLEPPNPMLDFAKPDLWEGSQEVHVVQLKLGKDEAAQRYHAALATAAAGLETTDTEEVTGVSLTGLHLPAEAAGSGDGGFAQGSEVAFDAKWSAYVQDSSTLSTVLGAPSQAQQPVKHREVTAAVSEQQLAADVVGIRFNTGVVSSVLPPVEADKMLLPPPYELRVVQQPPKRPKRLPLPNFNIWTLPSTADIAAAGTGPTEGPGSVLPEEAAATATSLSRPLSSMSAASKAAEPAAPAEESKKSPAVKAGKSAVVRQPSAVVPIAEADDITKRGLTEMSRWVIPPHGSVQLVVQFASDTIGRFSEVLGFDVVCGERNEKVVLSGSCDYPRISTDARNLYYKTAKARPSTPMVKQQYIQPTSTFEFGPVVAGRDRSLCMEPGHPDHTAKFRITNSGLFDLHADFWLKSEGPNADPAVTAAAVAAAGEDKKKKDKVAATGKPTGKAAASTAPPFLLQPVTMDLAVDDTQELTVYAFPSSEGCFTDVVMCRLKDNPVPLEFPISVIGAKPSVMVKLEDPPASHPDSKAAAARLRPSDAGAVKSVVKPAAGAKALLKAELTMQFDRLLLGKKDTHSIRVSNTGVLPFKWRLAGTAHLPPEFKVYPAAGELAARSDVRVTVEFTAIKKQDLAELITLEVLDTEEALGVSRAIPIAIKGEAHDIHVDIKFPQDNLAGVDFGPLRVVDDCVKQLVLRNTEKYEVKFDFAVRSEEVKRLVTIFPEDGAVLPNKEVVIMVHWNKDHSLKQEISFTGNTDIVLSLIDPSKDIREQQLPIKLSGHAQFSHYAITPARGLHFGPNTYNSLSKPRCFEVVNLGGFPFKLRVFDMYAKQNAGTVVEKAATEEAAAPKTARAKTSAGRRPTTPNPNVPAVPEAPPGALQLGQFTLDPAEAVVQPGCRQEVSVVFRAMGSTSWSAVAGLDISERDFVDQPDGIPYELGGESCIPGIDTSNIGAIFEEHVVLSHLDPFKPINCSFGLRDKVFNFGTLLAQLPEAGDATAANAETTSTAAGKKGAAAKGAALKAARASISGNPAAVAGAATASNQQLTSLIDEPGAVKANLKFTNPIKVPCTVNLTIKPRGGNQPGVRFPMEVYPSSIVIPPHEYRHVTLVFCPSAIQQYSATFEASVVGGAADPATSGFVCEVRGEGTLPSLSFQEPSALDSCGRPWLKFGKLLAGRESQLLLNVRNNGLLPASARLEMEPSPAFTLVEGTQVFDVESKKAATFTVAFHPPEVGVFNHELELRVKQNPFEQYRVALTGESYQEDLMFTGLPEDSLNVLRLPDAFLVPATVNPPTGSRPASRLSQQDIALPNGSVVTAAAAAAAAASQAPAGNSSYTFGLMNVSSNKHFRFKWPEHSQLKFSPSVGHIHAGQSKSINVTFAANTPVKLDGQDIKLAISQITYKGEPIHWDDVLAASMVAAGVRASSATRASSGLPGAGPKPGAEPLVDLVAKTQRDLPLKVHATADTPRYECSAPSPAIVFRPTMMFQTRSFTFTLTNSALTALDYSWQILGVQGEPDTTGLYEISPESGTVPGGAVQQFALCFSPQEVEDVTRRLVCYMPQLEQLAAAGPAAAATLAGLKQLTREVTGKVLRPWCHFELPDSDYMSSGRRNPELPGPSGVVEPLDPATKVLEFNSLGVRVRNTKQFFVLNSTSITYDFVWAPVLPPAVAALGGPPPASPFRCLTRKGTVAGGRRYEMVFEYTPNSDTLYESFWTFSIPSQGILVPFMLVGNVAEPRVSLDRPAINFGQVQLGVRGKIMFTLVNDEHLPFSFSLDKGTYDASDALLAASGGKPLLDIQPASGTVAANSKVELCAVYAPQAERPINYNVVVRVRNKPTPLVLNVKGEGYALQPSMLLELPDDGSLEMSPAGINTLDFGQVVINDRVVKSFSLVNSGRVNYDFVWDLGSEPSLSVKPQAGSVPRGERRVVELSFAPTAPAKLGDCSVSCQVTNGPRYKFVLKGSGYTPNLNFSFLSHDFGPCHVWQQGMAPTTVMLKVQNHDKQAVSYDVLFDNTDTWQVQSSPCVLAPGHSQDIPISFKPTMAQTYDAAVPIRVNGLYNINILLTGEGVPLRVELAKPEQLQRGLTFGAVPCGSSCSRTLSLVNRGRAAAFIGFEPSVDMLERLGIEVMPAAGVLLRPKEASDVTMWYRPKQRMRPFKEPLRALVAGVEQVLTTVAGACTGLSVLLASDSIPFGSVVLGSRTTKRLQLSNVGDLGCKFNWNTKPLGRNFTINPAEGFLAPGQDVKLEVSFHPATVNPDIRVERLHCRLFTSSSAADSGSRSASPLPGTAAAECSSSSGLSSDLLLTLTGACMESEAVGEPVAFKCNVRTSTSKALQLRNASSTNWQLRPVIQNEFWSGAEFLQVPAGGSAEYTLVYKPLTMTSADGPPHEGSVFFPIPDGTGLLYKLHGQADQPTPEAVVDLSLPAKTQHSQMLKVTNWLHKPQRFKVIKELLVGEASTRLDGATAIDVPALCDREYKLSVYSYTQGLTHARITFKNETTGEYTYYELKLSSSAPAPVSQLALECPVRCATSSTISVTNPMSTPVTMKPTVTSKQISLHPDPPVLAANSATSIEVRYRPLLVGSSDAVLRLDSQELGSYEWKLRLKGAPTNPERSLAFSAPLGTRDTQVFRFTHWLPEKVEYKCSFKHSSKDNAIGGNVNSSSGFDAPVTITAPPAGPNGVEVECVVGFEPSAIGEAVRDVLLVSSAAAGAYEVPLMGQCVPPKPQGPVDVSKGSASIQFRNVFSVDAEFLYSVDNPAFAVGKTSEKLPAKKPVSISISYKLDAAGKAIGIADRGVSAGKEKPEMLSPAPLSRTGKLTITCPKQTSTQWVYYLQA